MAKNKTKIMWTDEQKRQLVLGAAGIQRGQLEAWLRGQGLTRSGFASLRERFLKKRPELHQELLNGVSIPTMKVVQEEFHTATRERKQQLIREYQACSAADKPAWLEAHGCPKSTAGYWIHAFGKEKKEKKEKKAPSTELSVRDGLNGHAPRRGRPSEVKITHEILPSTPVVPAEIPTLADGIRSLEIQRDELNATIDRLKRMHGGFGDIPLHSDRSNPGARAGLRIKKRRREVEDD